MTVKPGQRLRTLYRIFPLVLAVLFLAFTTALAVGGTLVISEPEVDQFPQVRFFFQAYDPAGFFIEDLENTEMEVVEDGTPLPVDQIVRQEPGLQVVIAINAGQSMDYRYNEISRLDMIRQALVDWSNAQPDPSPDIVSLVTNTGGNLVRMTTPHEWVAAFQGFYPDLQVVLVSPNVLSDSLDILRDIAPRPNMKRAILYITSLPQGNALELLPAEIDRAAQLDARVYVWLVGSSTLVNSYQANLLQSLADRTGGKFILFTGEEGIPVVEDYFQPLRYIYRLSYTSAARTSGDHTLVLRLNREDQQAASSEKTFQVTVEPPNPMFLAQPTVINRRWTGEAGTERLEPLSVPLSLLIEFPDGHLRPLVYSRLYVNGELATEVTQSPFDRFEWDVTAFTTSQTVNLRVEVGDSLGLSRSTIEIPVELLVEEPLTSPVEALPDSISLALIIGASAGAAAILILVILLWRRARRARRGLPAEGGVLRGRKGERQSLQTSTVPRFYQPGSSAARLVRLSASGNPIEGMVIAFKQPEVLIGSDPKKVNILLQNPSVDSVHARMMQNDDKSFRLFDNQSLAGTWVNYSPVSSEGVCLEHGDLVNFGKLAFRFEESQPSIPRRPRSQPYKEPL